MYVYICIQILVFLTRLYLADDVPRHHFGRLHKSRHFNRSAVQYITVRRKACIHIELFCCVCVYILVCVCVCVCVCLGAAHKGGAESLALVGHGVEHVLHGEGAVFDRVLDVG